MFLKLHAEADSHGGGRIVDASGREVLLRGVNVNSLGEYWQGNEFDPTFPFDAGDAEVVRDIGWNTVRLVLSWSRVEPEPRQYDEAYLDEVASIIDLLEAHGIYTIVDMHQDAWSATLYARSDERCPPPLEPNLGWDGAPEWATFDGGQPHCHQLNRELSPAVTSAWDAFFADQPGPGDVGIQTRFVDMWRHVAQRFADEPAVAAFEILNEPNAFSPDDNARLVDVYARTFDAIREGEREGNGFEHIVMFEPSIVFSGTGTATPPEFANDGNVIYGPHIYTGTFPVQAPPDETWFRNAAEHAAALGGVPIVNGEWGGRPRSRGEIDQEFYTAYQALSDEFGFGAMFWLYESSCGDPHEIDQVAEEAAGLYVVDCTTNEVIGMRDQLLDLLARPYPRAVDGVVASFSFDPESSRFELTYRPQDPSRADTTIAVPRRRFPDGYRVEVEGATVVSDPDASTLLLRGCPGASEVTLTVTPGAGVADSSC